eukprot:TRINITY_DN685_c0_g1_i1.p1 TRINITY_DN685_c0_g1~~TRINITY_DN685_c0_g1_i1.p1  ORF type:complete len:351 (-),score=77.92 TRINITY_DN685_c0_g1_i1:1862-2914(-)
MRWVAGKYLKREEAFVGDLIVAIEMTDSPEMISEHLHYLNIVVEYFIDQEKWGPALDYCKRNIKALNPYKETPSYEIRYAISLSDLGWIYCKMKKFSKSLQVTEKSRDLFLSANSVPTLDEVKSSIRLAQLFYVTGRWELADTVLAEHIARLLEHDFKLKEVLLSLLVTKRIIILYDSNQYESCFEFINQMLEVLGDNSTFNFYEYLAELYLKTGDTISARNVWAKIIGALSPGKLLATHSRYLQTEKPYSVQDGRLNVRFSIRNYTAQRRDNDETPYILNEGSALQATLKYFYGENVVSEFEKVLPGKQESVELSLRVGEIPAWYILSIKVIDENGKHLDTHNQLMNLS